MVAPEPADAPPEHLATRAGAVRLPVFVPDATRAVIRGVTGADLEAAGVEALLVSTAHLAVHPGASVVRSLGGIQAFMGWRRPVFSDSGGFQAMSLVEGEPGLARVTSDGLAYRFSTKQRFRRLTPRSCIETQLRLGSDVIYCLDYCTHPRAGADEQERSVALTLKWAAACRAAFDELTQRSDSARPLLFAVVQGGPDPALRRRCASELAALGFDGYGFGGYPVLDGQLVDAVSALPALLPPGSVLHGLGIGSPAHLVTAWRAGFRVFDCVLPTRNGRRGVLYRDLPDDPATAPRCGSTANLLDERWVRERGPVDPGCDCAACTNYSAGYLAHLFRIEDRLAATLGSIHNLRFYSRLIDALRRSGHG